MKKNNGTIAKFIDESAVNTKIAVEKTRAEGAESAITIQIETLTSAVTDNEKVVAAALNQIIESVGLDGSGNSPLPGNISLVDAVSTLSGSNHTHANKGVLDGITSEKVTAWNAAEVNAISSAKTYTDDTIAALDLANTYEAKGAAADAFASAKTYTDGLDAAMDARVDVLERDSHTHANKDVLDGITTDKVAAWDGALEAAKAYTDEKLIKIDCGTY